MRNLVLVLDAAALGLWLHFVPWLNRPLDALALLVVGLGILTALAVKREWVRGLAVSAAVLGALTFGLEMAQKRFNLLGILDGPAPAVAAAGASAAANPYAWDARDPESYIAARRRAVADGLEPEAFAFHAAGDVFAGVDKTKLVVSQYDQGGWTRRIESLKPVVTRGEAMGDELTPDNLIRYRGFYRDEAHTFLDARAAINRFGFRETRGDANADRTYVFLGCSMTFGYFLGDDETMPHYFSAAGGFADRVANLAYSGYGPQNALRDLELNYHMGRAGIDPGTVKGVVYSLIDDHARRAMLPDPPDSPRYTLDNGGRLRLEPPLDRQSPTGRLLLALEMSRIYPELRERLYYNINKGDTPRRWRLTYAMLARMDALCRERYGVGLTVLYWGDDAEVARTIRESGMRLIPVADALGADWKAKEIAYTLIDGHPSAFANRKIGQFIRAAMKTADDGK